MRVYTRIFYLTMRPAGVEPTNSSPKLDVISISPRARENPLSILYIIQ